MASAPDPHPDSPPPAKPSDAPDHLSPGNREDRQNVESPDEGGSTSGSACGSGTTKKA